MRWRIRPGGIGSGGRCAATTVFPCPRPACCACSARRGCCWKRATSGNAASSGPPESGVRRRADGCEPGVAAGLHRVRDHRGRDLAAGRLPGLLEQVRAWLARVPDGEPARRDRRGRVRSHRGRAVNLPAATRAGPARRRRQRRAVDPNVTDNGGPFRSFRFEAFIAIHPELRHVRTRVSLEVISEVGCRCTGSGSRGGSIAACRRAG